MYAAAFDPLWEHPQIRRHVLFPVHAAARDDEVVGTNVKCPRTCDRDIGYGSRKNDGRQPMAASADGRFFMILLLWFRRSSRGDRDSYRFG
jgi:hypothetical protein